MTNRKPRWPTPITAISWIACFIVAELLLCAPARAVDAVVTDTTGTQHVVTNLEYGGGVVVGESDASAQFVVGAATVRIPFKNIASIDFFEKKGCQVHLNDGSTLSAALIVKTGYQDRTRFHAKTSYGYITLERSQIKKIEFKATDLKKEIKQQDALVVPAGPLPELSNPNALQPYDIFSILSSNINLADSQFALVEIRRPRALAIHYLKLRVVPSAGTTITRLIPIRVDVSAKKKAKSLSISIRCLRSSWARSWSNECVSARLRRYRHVRRERIERIRRESLP